jgi:hypothetical protein
MNSAGTLTPRQSTFVQRAAGLLPAAAQPQFLRSVSNMLGYAEYPLNDRDVLDVLRLVLAERGVSVGELLPPWAHNYANKQKGDHHATRPVFRPPHRQRIVRTGSPT